MDLITVILFIALLVVVYLAIDHFHGRYSNAARAEEVLSFETAEELIPAEVFLFAV